MGDRWLAVGLLWGVLVLPFVPAAVGAFRDAWRETRRPTWDRRAEWHRSKGPNR